MSLAASRRVWTTAPKNIKGGEFTLLLALADYADERSICWPTLRQAADKAHLEERQATSLLHKLEQRGQVVVTRKTGRGGGILCAILTGMNDSERVRTLHLYEAEKVQFLTGKPEKVQFSTGKGAISSKEKVQFLHEPEAAFDAPLSAETPLSAQCNDHKNDHEQRESTRPAVAALLNEPAARPVRTPSPPVAPPPAPSPAPAPTLATATPTRATARQAPTEIAQPRLVEADVLDPVDVYREVCEVRKPNQQQREAIRAAVTSHPGLWREVCAKFRAANWNVRNVPNLLDAYQKAVADARKAEARRAAAVRVSDLAPADEPPATPEQRRELLARFRAWKEPASGGTTAAA